MKKMKSKSKRSMNKPNGSMADVADKKRMMATAPKGKHNQPKGSSDAQAKPKTKKSMMQATYGSEKESCKEIMF
jgi:hypothetical protein